MSDTPESTAKPDWRSTVFLPKTDFPMKAGLPAKEPGILAKWQADGAYQQLRAARAGREKYILHDGPPYAFLWHLRDGMKPGGEVIVVDADRPTKRHGTPPRLLDCEFAAVGLTPARRHEIAGADAYFVAYTASAPRPAPGAIVPCKG